MVVDLPKVRIAQPEDEASIMAMCRRLWEENGLFTYNEDKVRECLHRCFEKRGTIVGVVGSPIIEGSICLATSDYYYTDDWHLAELWNFVDEPYRKSRNAEALVMFGLECSKLMGIPFLTGIITNKQMSGKVRLYQRLLGHPSGAFFICNSPWKSEPLDDRSELREKLRTFASECNNGKMSPKMVREKIGPLLREAAEAIRADDNLWRGSAKKDTNGAHASAS